MDDETLFATLLLLHGPPARGWFYDNKPQDLYGIRISMGSPKYKLASIWRYDVTTSIAKALQGRGTTKKFNQYLRWLHVRGAADLTPPRQNLPPGS